MKKRKKESTKVLLEVDPGANLEAEAAKEHDRSIKAILASNASSLVTVGVCAFPESLVLLVVHAHLLDPLHAHLLDAHHHLDVGALLPVELLLVL